MPMKNNEQHCRWCAGNGWMVQIQCEMKSELSKSITSRELNMNDDEDEWK